MASIRLNQLHSEIMNKIDEKDIAIKEDIATSLQYTVGPTAPEAPSIGYRWFDTVTSLMKVWNGEGVGADWEIINSNAIYLPGRNYVESLSTTRKQQTTGSGFVGFGGTIKSDKTINKSMMANSGSVRLQDIVTDETTGETRKEFWFENFFLLNGNGYEEETLDSTTGEETRILVNGLSVTVKGTLPNIKSITNNDLMAINLPKAPNSVSELTRDELVFIEVWKEDITETGFIFPYGNVQFTGDTADGIMTTGFTGEVGYCESFAGDCIYDEENIAKPKGRGWIWKDQKAAFKNIIASNYEHNIFVDGDKLVQIRYRVRVVPFAKNTPIELTNTTVLGFTKDNDITSKIKAQGKLSTTLNEDNYVLLSAYNDDNSHKLNGTFSTEYTTDLSHDGYTYAIPVAIVSRRNTGVFDTIFNPNGSAKFRNGIRLVSDYDSSDDIIGFALMDAENATLASSTTGKTWEEKYDIMMNWLFDRTTVIEDSNNDVGFVIGGDMDSGISGRYDNLYYDEINERDICDLRVDVNKQFDLTHVLEQEFNKFILGDQRGWENEFHLHYWKGNAGIEAEVTDANGVVQTDNAGNVLKGYGFVTELPIHYTLANGEIAGIDQIFADRISSGLTTVIYLRSGVAIANDIARVHYSDEFVKRVQVKLEEVYDENNEIITDENGNVVYKLKILDGAVYVDEETEILIASPKNNTTRKTILYSDIIGDPAGNSFKYTTQQTTDDLDESDILENGNIVFTGQNYYVYRGTRRTRDEFPFDTSGKLKVDETDTNLWIDVTDQGSYSEGWKKYGNLGTALLVDEEGKSVLPRDVLSGLSNEDGTRSYLNSKFFKLSRPVKNIKCVIVSQNRQKSFFTKIVSTKQDENGNSISIIEQVDDVSGTFAFENSKFLTDNNTIMINWNNLTDDAIIEIYYEVEANPTAITGVSQVENIGDVWIGNSLYQDLGGQAIADLISKIPVHDAPIGSKGAAKRIPLNTYLISKGEDGSIMNADWTVLTHDPVDLDGTGPAIKILPYLSSIRGELYLKLLYKELDQTTFTDAQNNIKSYILDNDQFVIVDGETTDTNGIFFDENNQEIQTKEVKVGQRKIKLPYFLGDAK